MMSEFEMTKREKFALAIAQGMAANPECRDFSLDDFSHDVVIRAESLIEYLEGTDTDKIQSRAVTKGKF